MGKFKDYLTEGKKVWVVYNGTDAWTTDGKRWGISNFGLFQEQIQKFRDKDYKKYEFGSKSEADKMAAKIGDKDVRVIELKV